MKIVKTHFYSDGLKLDASFYLPKQKEYRANTPAIVICSGFLGLRNIHPARFGRALTRHGYLCFGFDYRGFGESEGERRRVILEEQIRDIIQSLAYVASHPLSLNRPLILAGWGMGGGLVLEAAKRMRGTISGLLCMNGFYSGARVQRLVRGGEKEWHAFLDWLHKEEQKEAQMGRPRRIDPFIMYPLDATTEGYVDTVLRRKKGFGGAVPLALARSLLSFEPEKRLERLSGIPLFIAHGTKNKLHPPEEARSLYRRYRGEKELYWVQGGGHTEWMYDDNPFFLQLMHNIDRWIQTAVIEQSRCAFQGHE